jgi:hypothetical protein
MKLIARIAADVSLAQVQKTQYLTKDQVLLILFQINYDDAHFKL